MAPIEDELRGQVKRLEAQVQDLQSKLAGRDAGKTSAVDSMRMIIMGPPGAGMNANFFRVFDCPLRNMRCSLTLGNSGKGTQAPKIKDKYCACHLV